MYQTTEFNIQPGTSTWNTNTITFIKERKKLSIEPFFTLRTWMFGAQWQPRKRTLLFCLPFCGVEVKLPGKIEG